MPRPIDPAIRAAIERAAAEDGVDPSFALAVADRESTFNPRARSSRTIRGLYQMRGDNRAAVGLDDTDDPYEQTKGWNRFLPGVRKEMASGLGRDPNDPEAYLGHHFGGRRAARMLRMDPSTPVDVVFTPTEMQANPHFGAAGTVGRLNDSVMADIQQRQTKFGGAMVPSTADLSLFGDPVEHIASPKLAPSAPQEPLDLASFGDPVEQHPQPGPMPAAPSAPLDLSHFGTPV